MERWFRLLLNDAVRRGQAFLRLERRNAMPSPYDLKVALETLADAAGTLRGTPEVRRHRRRLVRAATQCAKDLPHIAGSLPRSDHAEKICATIERQLSIIAHNAEKILSSRHLSAA